MYLVDSVLNLSMNNKNDTIVPTENGNFIEPPPMRWTLRLIFVVVFIVGVIGNSVVCAAVIRRKRMRTSNNIFTFNLALCDLLNVVIYLPTQMAAFENDHNWAVGNFMCLFVYILVPLCLCASIGTLLAITCDRYRAIAYPMKPRLSGKMVKIILATIWSSSLVICFPLIFVAGEIRPSPGKVYCDETWPAPIYMEIYWNFIFVIQYFLPLTIIAVLAVLIAIKIRQNNAIHLLPKSSQAIANAVRQRMKQTSKITNMLIALVVLYAICMLPQHIHFLWFTYGNLKNSKYSIYVLRFSNVFPMANSALNPIAYGTLNKEFKKVFKGFFECDCRRSDSDVYSAKRTPNPLNRSGKFRLAVYKHANEEDSSSDAADKGRKCSTPSLASFGKRKDPRRKGKKDLKKGSDIIQDFVPNGNATLSTSVNSQDHNCNEQGSCKSDFFEIEDLDVNVSPATTKDFLKLRARSPLLEQREEEQELLMNERRKEGKAVTERGFKDRNSLQDPKKAAYDETTPQFGADDYGRKLDLNALDLKDNITTQLLAHDFENDAVINSWVEVTNIDKKLLAYISALKETDI